MKFSKLLSFILGLSGFFTFRADGSDGGGAVDVASAADLFGAVADAEEVADETPEDAAARLVAEDAAGEAGEAEEGEQEQEQAAAPETVTIEVDGKPVQMTKAELAEAVKGQMKAADYTQKTMALSDQHKAAAAEKEAATKERYELAQKLHTYSVRAEGNLAQIEEQLTDELLNSDPVGYMSLERTLRKGQADLTKAKADMQELYQQHQAEQQEASKNFMKEQHDILVAKLPEWKDAEKMKAGMGLLDTFLTERGYKAEDGNTILDARLLLMANDAMKYRDLMDRASKASKKVVAAPVKVERTGTPAADTRSAARDAQMKKLSKSGSVRDAAALFDGF